MSSSTSLQGLWSRPSKRVPGLEAGKVGMEETPPPGKPQPDTEPALREELKQTNEGFKADEPEKDGKADVQMKDAQADVPAATVVKEQVQGKKRKGNPGPQTGAKRSKQTSVWAYPTTPSEEDTLLQAAVQERLLLHEDLKNEGKLSVPAQSVPDSRRCIAEQIEESSLPYSALAQSVFDRLTLGGHSTTPAAVRSSILSLAERVNYGAQNADADVLEDDAEDSCWKWEVRDTKLLPEGVREEALDRRKCRRKMSERLASLDGLIAVLNDGASTPANRKAAFNTVAALLKKQEDRAAITRLAEDLARKREAKQQARDVKNAAKDAERAAKMQEKEHQKVEKDTEKEKQRAEKEAERLKSKEEKERERAEKEAEKERLRAEKEAQRQEKEAAREKEEAEKERQRAEREALEQKKKAQMKKSASFMDRFVIKKRPSEVKPEKKLDLGPGPIPKAEGGNERSAEKVGESETVKAMDKEFAESMIRSPTELKRLYVKSFQEARPALKRQPRSYWGLRRTPKKAVQNAIRLAGDPFAAMREPRSKTPPPPSAKGKEKPVVDVSDDDDDMEEEGDVTPSEERPGKETGEKRRGRYKLLQLGEMGKTCNRPPYYGTWSRKSNAVSARRPLALDAEMDYEVDSDEEWEEEDPGESLSSSDKEDNEEEDKQGYGSEDEEDGFVVPSGYLSQDEGIDLDSPPTAAPTADASPIVDEHVATLQKLQRKLEKATRVALRTSKPLIVSALLPPVSGDHFLGDGGVPVAGNGRFIYEGNQAFLQAMTIQVLRSDVCIEVPAATPTGLEEEPVVRVPGGEEKKGVGRPRMVLPEEKVPELIEFLLGSTHGMARNVDELSAKFPGVSKKHLEQRIREIAEYEGGRWQVKAVVLAKYSIGLPQTTPAATAAPPPGQEETPKSRPTPRVQPVPITKFFTKVSSGSQNSKGSQDNSKGGQSEKSPMAIDREQKGSQEAKSVMQAGVGPE
ncbi:chromatin assembly factor-1 [Klebsormidium nitens]|uniref:Chromatin assembly factor-1 n=1 Tax=Klebsormidium nitens TaxID=105231 RepID=A0A1Y1HQA8_KLENI|nr:chromatin assembly factor-1 [Klebsormidium nitens]|eukprot:GAQ80815.1 chromatin assembly factor-1 [Klebsormidium nitens]